MARSDPDADAVVAVQEAAVEHALTAGDARRALALAGALEPLRGEVAARSGTPDPVAAALLSALTAWVGLREDGTLGPAGPPAPPAPPIPGDDDRDPAAVGAAVACERFGVPPARAASLAGAATGTVERLVAARERRPDR